MQVSFTIGTRRAHIDFRENDGRVSYSAIFDGSSGQCRKLIESALREAGFTAGDTMAEAVLRDWRTYHLNGAIRPTVAALKNRLWLLDGVVYANGREIDDAPADDDDGLTPDDAPDLDDTRPDIGDNTLDSRDLEEHREALAQWLSCHGADGLTDSDNDAIAAVIDENRRFEAFCKAGESYAPDWHSGETLILDSHFEEYAEQLAEDVGAIDRNAAWPLNHIDWEAAARNLQQDYSAIEYESRDGEETRYWIR